MGTQKTYFQIQGGNYTISDKLKQKNNLNPEPDVCTFEAYTPISRKVKMSFPKWKTEK